MSTQNAARPAMERAFSTDAMSRRDSVALAERHAETPLLLALLGEATTDAISSPEARTRLEAGLALLAGAKPIPLRPEQVHHIFESAGIGFQMVGPTLRTKELCTRGSTSFTKIEAAAHAICAEWQTRLLGPAAA